MIRINLLGEKVDTTATYGTQILLTVGTLVLILGGCFFAQTHFSGKLEIAKNEKSELEADLAKLKIVTEKVAKLEKNKKTLQEKLTTIAGLIARQQGPVRILDELNNYIPERTWLTTIKEKDGFLNITGIALDNQTIAVFIGNLEKSKYVEKIDLNHSTQEKVKDVKMKKFALTVGLRDPLKINQPKQAAAGKKLESHDSPANNQQSKQEVKTGEAAAKEAVKNLVGAPEV